MTASDPLLTFEADSAMSAIGNMAALAGPLRLPEQAAEKDAARHQAVLGWLNDNPG
jgi:hypothetical protein